MFPWDPMSPEQIGAAKKARAEARTKGDRLRTAALPHLREAQRALREAIALGCDGHHLVKARHNLARFVEDVETDLVREL